MLHYCSGDENLNILPNGIRLFNIKSLKIALFSGIQSQASRHPCYCCKCYRVDSQGYLSKGGNDVCYINVEELRTLDGCEEDYQGFLLASSGMEEEKAKKDLGAEFFGQVNPPFKLHKDGSLPLLSWLLLDPLHDLLLGKLCFKFLLINKNPLSSLKY